VDGHEQRLNEQFEQQQQADDLSLLDYEKELRNDRESFRQVRRLLPTRTDSA
jgi:Tfp pilus assembly protein PilO